MASGITSKQINSGSKETLNALQGYHWPRNVGELESVIERAVITRQGSALQALDRFEPFRKTAVQNVKALVGLERNHLLRILQKTGWRIEGKSAAAVLLGINPSTLRARIRIYGMRRQ